MAAITFLMLSRQVCLLAGSTVDVLYESTEICSYRDDKKSRKTVHCVTVHLSTVLKFCRYWSVQPFLSLLVLKSTK